MLELRVQLGHKRNLLPGKRKHLSETFSQFTHYLILSVTFAFEYVLLVLYPKFDTQKAFRNGFYAPADNVYRHQ